MNTIIWDWNGTLLNDLDLCISTINVLLRKRNLQELEQSKYKEVFSFPVKSYYKAVGFDFEKEDFAIPAREFIDLYNSMVENCDLHQDVFEILSSFKKQGYRQFVLSAMKQDMLEKTLKHHKIIHFFEDIAGLNDHYAVSKIERGQMLIEQNRIERENTWIIGDTVHDYEVAGNLGVNCILIADGHQSEDRLRKTGVVVLNKIEELRNFETIKVKTQ